MSDERINDRSSAGEEEDSGEEKGNVRNTLLGFLATFALVAVIFGIWRGCDHLRVANSSPDRVHAAYAGTLRGRPVLYILNSMLMNEDDHEDRLNDSAYRLDVYDQASGERISRTSMGTVSPHRSYDSDGVAAFPSASLSDGSELRISKSTGRLERTGGGGSPAAPSTTFIRGGLLHDIATHKPVEPGTPGSCVVLHYESDDDDAEFLLTALGADGGVLWKATSEGFGSDATVRAALRMGKDLILITDEDIIYVDAAKGTVERRVEM